MSCSSTNKEHSAHKLSSFHLGFSLRANIKLKKTHTAVKCKTKRHRKRRKSWTDFICKCSQNYDIADEENCSNKYNKIPYKVKNSNSGDLRSKIELKYNAPEAVFADETSRNSSQISHWNVNHGCNEINAGIKRKARIKSYTAVEYHQSPSPPSSFLDPTDNMSTTVHITRIKCNETANNMLPTKKYKSTHRISHKTEKENESNCTDVNNDIALCKPMNHRKKNSKNKDVKDLWTMSYVFQRMNYEYDKSDAYSSFLKYDLEIDERNVHSDAEFDSQTESECNLKRMTNSKNIKICDNENELNSAELNSMTKSNSNSDALHSPASFSPSITSSDSRGRDLNQHRIISPDSALQCKEIYQLRESLHKNRNIKQNIDHMEVIVECVDIPEENSFEF